MKIRYRVTCLFVLVVFLLCVTVGRGATIPRGWSTARLKGQKNSTSIAVSGRSKSEGRFFLKVSDIAIHLLERNIESVPAPLRGPLMFFMGFSQQSMENIMSNMRSFGQMIITSLIMMAVKRIYFSDLPTEADRNKASELTDSVMNVVNIFI